MEQIYEVQPILGLHSVYNDPYLRTLKCGRGTSNHVGQRTRPTGRRSMWTAVLRHCP